MSNLYYLDTTLDQIDPVDLTLFRTRMFRLLETITPYHQGNAFEVRTGIPSPAAQLSPAVRPANANETDEIPRFVPMQPAYRFDQLILPESVMQRLLDTTSLVEVAPIVFGTWNLRSIEPNPSVAVSFRGPPGTGKTLAAHAIAHRLGRPILSARLSDLESKYHGDGPKNLVGLFDSARGSGAVLFIDEAESLLSRRFAQPSQAAESAINSMRTELLMAIDAFDGLVIFASNLPHSYDAAAESRLISVDFELPDAAARRTIWRSHCPPQLPLADDVSFDTLAEIDGLSGRDIKLSVIAAAVHAARKGDTTIRHVALEQAARSQLATRRSDKMSEETLSSDEVDIVQQQVADAIVEQQPAVSDAAVA